MKAKLIELIKKYSLEYGEFTLKSGQKSNYYLDLRKLHLVPEGLATVVDMIDKELPYDGGPAFDCFGGPSIGADPIIGGLVHDMGLWYGEQKGFLIRPEAKDHGKGGRIVGWCEGRCVLIEDVVTTGGSSLDAVKVVESVGASVVKVICVVDRLQGGREMFESLGIPFVALIGIDEILDKESKGVQPN